MGTEKIKISVSGPTEERPYTDLFFTTEKSQHSFRLEDDDVTYLVNELLKSQIAKPKTHREWNPRSQHWDVVEDK